MPGSEHFQSPGSSNLAPDLTVGSCVSNEPQLKAVQIYTPCTCGLSVYRIESSIAVEGTPKVLDT